MKQFFTSLQNIWEIDELRKRILYTLGLLFVYRVGSFVLLPGVVPSQLEAAAAGGGNDLLGLINVFTGGAFSKGAVFALGIMPYITASIIVQLLGFAIPYFKKLQTREGESGRKQLNQITRFLTIAITLVQGGAYLTYLDQQAQAIDPNLSSSLFYIAGLIILTGGTVFAMWLGEKITDKGIGNGVSLLITIGIIATLPTALIGEFSSRSNSGGLFLFAVELFALFGVVMLTVLLVQGIRKIPVQYVKRMVGRGTADITSSGAGDNIPVKVIAAGVMPIIFAQALMFVPSTIAQLGAGNGEQPGWLLNQLNDFTSPVYNVVYFILVVVFTYVYTALIVDPQQYSEFLKSRNGFIPGVKPGTPTADFIDSVTTRITLPGAMALGLIAILPAVAARFLGVDMSFAIFFGGTSLLIMVAVVLDTLQQIQSYLLMRRYDGLVKSGRVQGKAGALQQIGSTI